MESLLLLIALFAIPFILYKAIKKIIKYVFELQEEKERKAWEREKEWEEKRRLNRP